MVQEKIKSLLLLLIQSLASNLVYKVLAVVVAVIFWYIVQGGEIIEISQQVRVNILVPDGYGVKGETTLVKDATVRGPRSLLAKLSKDTPLEAEIRITDERRDSYRLRLGKDHIRRWNDRAQLTIHEAYIRVEVDKLAVRELPVEILLQGVPADGYIIEKTTVEPELLTVIGLQSILEKMHKVITAPVDVDGLQNNRTIIVGLAGEDTVSYSKQQVKVSLQVGEKKINQTFTNIPIDVVGKAKATSIDPETIAITVQGVPAVLNFIDNRSFQAFIDVSGLTLGRHERKVAVKIPEGTTIIETVPENVFVDVAP